MNTGKTIALGFALLVTAVAGCGTSSVGGGATSGPIACTEIGCGAAFRVEFTRASWPAGTVNVVVDADGTTTNCSVTLPFASCDAAPQCDQASPPFLLELVGCALPPAQQTIGGIFWPTTGPQQVTVTISQDGTMLGTQMFQPTYSMSSPNGPDCPPVCNQAPSATLAL